MAFRKFATPSVVSYSAVFGIFLVASALRDSTFAVIIVAVGICVSLLLKLHSLSLLIIAIPFQLPLQIGPVLATLSISHLVLPLIAFYIFRSLVLKEVGGRQLIRAGGSLGIAVLMLISTPFASFYSDVQWSVFIISALKLVISACFGVIAVLAFREKQLQTSLLVRLAQVWAVTALLVGTAGLIAQRIRIETGIRSPFDYGSTRLMSTFENPNHFGVYMIFSAAITLVPAYFLGRRRYLVLSLALTFFAVSSGSQSAYFGVIALGVVGILSLWKAPGWRLNQAVFSLAALAFVSSRFFSLDPAEAGKPGLAPAEAGKPGLAPAEAVESGLERPQVGVRTNTWEATQILEDSRWTIWREALELWIQHPLLGIGYGQFEHRESVIGGLTHNTLLGILVGSGTVIFLVVSALIGYVLVSALRSGEIDRRLVAIAFVGVAVAGLGNDLLNSTILWFAFGLMSVAKSKPKASGVTDP